MSPTRRRNVHAGEIAKAPTTVGRAPSSSKLLTQLAVALPTLFLPRGVICHGMAALFRQDLLAEFCVSSAVSERPLRSFSVAGSRELAKRTARKPTRYPQR